MKSSKRAARCPSLRRISQVAVTETIDQVIVHHTHGLHVGVADGAAHELETSPFQVLAQSIRFKAFGGDFPDRLPSILFRLIPNESPDIVVKRAELVLHKQKQFRILDGSLDLQRVADDPGILQQTLSLFLAVPGYLATVAGSNLLKASR